MVRSGRSGKRAVVYASDSDSDEYQPSPTKKSRSGRSSSAQSSPGGLRRSTRGQPRVNYSLYSQMPVCAGYYESKDLVEEVLALMGLESMDDCRGEGLLTLKKNDWWDLCMEWPEADWTAEDLEERWIELLRNGLPAPPPPCTPKTDDFPHALLLTSSYPPPTRTAPRSATRSPAPPSPAQPVLPPSAATVTNPPAQVQTSSPVPPTTPSPWYRVARAHASSQAPSSSEGCKSDLGGESPQPAELQPADLADVVMSDNLAAQLAREKEDREKDELKERILAAGAGWN